MFIDKIVAEHTIHVMAIPLYLQFLRLLPSQPVKPKFFTLVRATIIEVSISYPTLLLVGYDVIVKVFGFLQIVSM